MALDVGRRRLVQRCIASHRTEVRFYKTDRAYGSICGEGDKLSK